MTVQQESPPVGNRKRRIARCITCPSISYRGGGGGGRGFTPSLVRGLPHPDLAGGGYPFLTWPGGPITGYPLFGTGVPPPGTEVPTWHPPGRDLAQSLRYPPERTWDQWKYYGMGMGHPPPV